MLECVRIWAFAALAFWVLLSLDRRRRWPGDMQLDPANPADMDAAVDEEVVVVIPARNEAGVLSECLPSILDQAGSFRACVLVDDGSTDGTAEVARRVVSERPRADLRIVPGTPTPPGWSGKLHALETGLSRALLVSGDGDPWILFTDADIRHGPGSIARLLERARKGAHDMVSVMARLRAEGFWERLLVPPFVYFFQLLYPFRRVADPRSGIAAAAGGCILLRASALARAGGLESVKGALIDDVSLARAVKRSGGRLWLGFARDVESLREYPRLADFTQMVARTAFEQLRYRVSAVVGTLGFLGALFVAPPFLAVAAASLGDPYGFLAALGAWGIQAGSLAGAVRQHRVPIAFTATLPVSAALYGYMTAVSALRHLSGRGVSWRGRGTKTVEKTG
jgi:hopene-associated glycosyltransferase HpnB